MMDGEVKIPVLGSVSKKEAALIGVGLAIVVGVAYYRHKQSAGSSATTAASAINPATGYPFGSAEDLAALNAQAASGLPAGGGSLGGITDPNGQNIPNDTTSFVDNAHWERAALDYLGGIGESQVVVSRALGKFLAGQPVDDAERSFVYQATAAMGQPPVAGANGYPPHIRAAQGGGGHGVKELAAAHISIAHQDKKTATLHWPGVPRAVNYLIQNNHGVSRRQIGTRVTVNKPGTFWIIAHAPGFKNSPESNHVTV